MSRHPWRYTCVNCHSRSWCYRPTTGIYYCKVCDHTDDRLYDELADRTVTRDQRADVVVGP